MKRAYEWTLRGMMMLAVGGCTPKAEPVAPPPAAAPEAGSAASAQPQSPVAPGAAATPEEGASSPAQPGESAAATGKESLEASLPKEKRDELHAGAQTLVKEFVSAFSRGDQTAAEASLISRAVFDEIVAPGFRGILGSGLLSKNHQELANLIEALQGRKVESWKWKPGTLVQSEAGSAFSRPLIQITGGTVELEVDGTYIAVRLDQLIELDGKWTIFQMHNL